MLNSPPKKGTKNKRQPEKAKATKLYEYQIHLKSNKIFYYGTQNYCCTHGNGRREKEIAPEICKHITGKWNL